MEESENKRLWLLYFDIKKENDIDKKIIKVEYLSESKIDKENRTILQEKFNDYINNEFNSSTDDIIDIVENVRNITRDLDERELNVVITSNNTCEEVLYYGGVVSSYEFSRKEWDDVVKITGYNRRIDISFKKSRFDIDDLKKVKYINNELSIFYKKIILLSNMTKIKSEKKDNTFKLVNIPRHKKND